MYDYEGLELYFGRSKASYRMEEMTDNKTEFSVIDSTPSVEGVQ